MAAIFMWRVTDIVIETTTLYPVDAQDGIDLSIDVDPAGFYMELIPNDPMSANWDLQVVSYTQLRWFYSDGPYTDDYKAAWDLDTVGYTQLRWFYSDGPYTDDYKATWDVQNVSYDNKLVEADSPDEGLDFSIDITPAGCEMELI